jgi:hypothetical protein
MPQPKQALIEGVSQVAGRILMAWRTGQGANLDHELAHARRFTSCTTLTSTLEMERLDALTGAVESLAVENGRSQVGGAVRLLEHLAKPEFSR